MCSYSFARGMYNIRIIPKNSFRFAGEEINYKRYKIKYINYNFQQDNDAFICKYNEETFVMLS